MAYTALSLTHFRSYVQADVTFSPGVTILVGPNGSGKTNLLEALVVLSQGSSFRVADRDLIQYHQPWFRLQAIEDERPRTMTYSTDKQPAKQFVIDGHKKQRLSYQQKVPLVLFEPTELRLLEGSPQRRREYIDGLISRLWIDGGSRRSRYERALLQRNNILKQATERSLASLEDELFVWDIKLAEYATALVESRLLLIEKWNEQLSELYSTIAGRTTVVGINYDTELQTEQYKADLLKHLAHRRSSDIVRGFTSVGPHRDDFVIQLSGVNAAVSASRGELRTLLLALKIIELRLLHTITERRPLLLLDDVFSELDTTRRQALAKLADQFQTVITTTDADIVKRYFTQYHRIEPQKL
jgi:DNA replication and repair protein RecF